MRVVIDGALEMSQLRLNLKKFLKNQIDFRLLENGNTLILLV
jgi:hypothetical protein